MNRERLKRKNPFAALLTVLVMGLASPVAVAQSKPANPSGQVSDPSDSADVTSESGSSESGVQAADPGDPPQEQAPAASLQSTDAGTAAESADPQDETPTIFHRPISNLPAGQSARVRAWIGADWNLDSITVGVRRIDSADAFTEIAMERNDTTNEFVAIAPAEIIQPPGVEYYIRAERAGNTQEGFGSVEQPHAVIVLGETEQTRRDKRLARHNGERSEFRFDANFTSFGSRVVPPPANTQTEHLSDIYGDAEFEYRYRTLSMLYDFSFGLGAMRGQRPTYVTDGETVSTGPGDEPGLNYGFGKVTFELHRNFSVEPKLLLGASERGFAAGAGGLLRVGRIEGTRLELGAEMVQDIGGVGFLRFAWDTVPNVPMSLTIESGDKPSNENAGVRLIYEAGYAFDGGVTLLARIGYATRSTGVEPGFVSGVGLRYGF